MVSGGGEAGLSMPGVPLGALSEPATRGRGRVRCRRTALHDRTPKPSRSCPLGSIHLTILHVFLFPCSLATLQEQTACQSHGGGKTPGQAEGTARCACSTCGPSLILREGSLIMHATVQKAGASGE